MRKKLYFDSFHSLILADDVIYLSFVIIHGNPLKYIAVTAQHCNENFA